MITFKNGYSKKDKSEIIGILEELIDLSGDFYITKNNIRLFIKDNIDILFECLKNGDYIAYDKDGIAIVLGFSDKSQRKYLKILTKKPEDVEKYIKIITWNIKEDLYCKIKKTNVLRTSLLKCNFIFKAGRGKELLLMRKANSNGSARYTPKDS